MGGSFRKRAGHTVLAVLLVFFSNPMLAATIVVDGMTCTLVDAITAANTDTAVGGCPAGSSTDTVRLETDVTLTEPSSSLGGWGDNGLPVITTEVVLEGGGFVVERDVGAPQFRIVAVQDGTLVLNDVTLRNGHANFKPPHAYHERGGAIHISLVGAVTLTNTTVTGNSALAAGGGINNRGTLTVTDSTIAGNSTNNGQGGGIFNEGATVLTNSTVSGNSAGQGGGGIYAYYYGGAVTLANSTVVGNSASSGGGISAGSHGFPFTMINTIVAGNSGGNCLAIYPLTDSGNNFADDDTCSVGFADIAPGVDVDTALADNGGPTLTHALLPGSVAIDAAGACGLVTDQRGVPRDDGACDSGSYEFEPPGQVPVSSPWSFALIAAGLMAVLSVLVALRRRNVTPA